MRDMQKTKKQLMEELETAREKISDLETMIRHTKETADVVRKLDTSVADLKRSEEALSESEEKFRAIVETSVDVMFQVDLEGRITYVSPSIEGLLGFTSDEIIGQVFSRFLKPSDVEMAAALFGEVLSGGLLKGLELEIPRKGGPPQMIEVTPILLRKDGQIAGLQGTVRDITARKKSERALQESEARFRLISENIPVVVYSVLPNQRPVSVFVSSRIIELTGYSMKEFAENPTLFRSMIHPDDREQAWAKIVEHRRKKAPLDIEYRIVTAAGQIRWVVNRANLQFDENSETISVTGFLEDITERKRVEADRQVQLEFLQTLIDAIPNPIFYKDIDQIYTGCNRAFEQFLGLPQTKIIGKSVYEVAPKDLADQYFERDGELLRHPGTQVYESKVSTGSGEVRDVIFSKATFAASDGKVAGLLGVIVDITDLKRTQTALALHEEVYRSRFESSPVAHWEEDLSKVKGYVEALRSKGVHDFRAYFRDHPEEVVTCSDMVTITDANAATLELFHCGTLEDLERLVHQHACHRTSQALTETLIAVSEGALSFARECATQTSGGHERFLSLKWVVVPAHTETMAKVQFLAVDITHLKQVETELRAAESKVRSYNEELEKTLRDRTERIRQLERQRSAAEAHAATGRLAARIAHEINNPLAGIKNSFLLVKRAVPKDHPRYEYVTLIEKEIDRIALIVRKMFELYRDEKQVRHEVSAVDCIREVLTISEGFLREKEISVEINAPDKPITAELPAGFLTQVVLNLLRNAADASKPHGTITISADADDGGMVVKVKDEGQGISDEDAPHIFEPFFTTKRGPELGGLGLGLAVSSSMVEAMGGSITFETCSGKGTTFTICLPTSGGHKEVRNGREG